MNKNVGADKDKFTISCYGIELPFEWYSMEYILKELGNSKLYFKNVVKMEKATNEKIKKYYKENEENLGENNRFFIYIKFFNVNGKNYGIVAGKTNYTNPDLLFDSRNGEKDNRYARIFLNNLSGAEWSETIVIVNHESSASEYADNQAALSNSSLPICPLREEKSLSQRAFSIYTDIRKLQDKAKTSYTLSTRGLRFGYE